MSVFGKPCALRLLMTTNAAAKFPRQHPGTAERRRWSRLPLALPVFVRARDNRGRELLEFATALNISAGGVLLASRRELPRPASICLEIPSAPVPEGVQVPHGIRVFKARLVRDLPAGRGHYFGFKFTRPLL